MSDVSIDSIPINDPKSLSSEALKFKKQGKYKDAISLFRKVLDLEPNNIIALNASIGINIITVYIW
jgi:tetratricopeptide (TPR) repeat protein